MASFQIFRVGFASCAAMLLVIVSQAAAQNVVEPPNTYLWDGGTLGTGTAWQTGSNWNIGASGTDGANNSVPYAYYHETGVIGSATFPGPFTVNVSTAQNLFVPFSAANNSRTQTGGVTVDLGSTLNIQGTGILKVVVTNGLVPLSDPEEAVTGTETGVAVFGTGNAIVNGAGAITIQTGGRLEVENDVNVVNGTLTVSPGGTVTGRTINSGAEGAIVLSGNASLTSTGTMTASGRTTINGPSVLFSSGPFVMADTSVFNPVVTNAISHTIMNVNGPVTINGTLRPQFQGVTPTLGSTWVIWDSTSTSGQFDVSDDSLTDLPVGHRYTVATTTVGSVHGTRGLLTVENYLTAEVNRANGQVTLRNTAATGGVTIDGYQIASAAAVLNPAGFTSSLDDDNFDGGEWTESNLTTGTIGELNANLGGSSLIATASSNLLGNFYDPIPTLQQFGDPVPEDLTFTYRRSDGRFVTGAVEYINDGIDNTLVLQVDPNDGKARIVNDSTFDGVRFDSYRVLSASGALRTTWNSLDDQNLGGANAWLEASPTANALSELNALPQSNPQSSVEVDAGQTAAVMTGLFNVAGTRDLVFEFRAASPVSTPPIGDYSGNGVVDAADYTVWRDMFGATIALPNEDPSTTPGSVTPEDYLVWKNNFGDTSSGGGLGAFEVFTGQVEYVSFALGGGALTSSPVPEPSAWMLAATLACGLLGTRCRAILWLK